MTYSNQKAVAYQQVSNQAASYADPHRLIEMLMDGFLMRVAAGRGAMQREDYDAKGRELGKALSILNGLQDTLDHDRGGEIAGNLVQLYDYMQRRLLEGSAQMDTSALDEVSGLMREIKSGWSGIREQATETADAASVGGLSVSG